MDRPDIDLPRTSQIAAFGLACLTALCAYFGTNYVKSEKQKHDVALSLTGGDPLKAPALFRRYGCAGCHEIPGIPGADGKVGGSLDGLKDRVYIGGVATNSPDNLVTWIVSPQKFSPKTAMPATGITEAEARDITAWLYQQ